MITAKTFLLEIVVVSFCLADISGIVIDREDTLPVDGAVVILEKNGRSAITGPDGQFTISTSSAVLPGNRALVSNDLSVRACNTRIDVTAAKRSTVVLSTYNLNGRLFSVINKTVNEGTHSILFPRTGTGLYIHLLQWDNGSVVITRYHNSDLLQGKTSSGHRNVQQSTMAKHAEADAAINDVIAVTKSGYLKYRGKITNADTSGIEINMIVIADTLRDGDGNLYHAIKIGKQVWTVEDLHTTKYINGKSILHGESAAEWDSYQDRKVAAYCKYGSNVLYTWHTVNRDIAPSGWHVPTEEEWRELRDYLISNGYNWDGTKKENKIAKSLAATQGWESSETSGAPGNGPLTNNTSGFSAVPVGYRSDSGDFYSRYLSVTWWSSTGVDDGLLFAWTFRLGFNVCNTDLGRYYSTEGHPIRLVRD